MIVIDTSVWIAYFRNEAALAMIQLIEDADGAAINEIVVGDLILLECLQGARDERHARKLERLLGAFRVMPMLSPTLAMEAARNYRKLRAAGITPRKMADLIIGTFCIVNGFGLVHADADFEPMEKLLGLKRVLSM